MDRISALRNVEDAIAAFEEGERSLAELEREVVAVLRTYATEFDERTAYRASGDPRAEGLVVLASSRREARRRIEQRLDDSVRFDVERVRETNNF